MKQIYVSLIIALLCVSAFGQSKNEKQKAVEMTFAAEPSAIRAEILKQGIRKGWTLCDESQSQVTICDKWHSRVVTRFRFRQRFILTVSNVTATTENYVENVGLGAPGTVTTVVLDGKKE